LTLKAGKLQDVGRPEKVLTPQAVAELYDFDQAGFSSHLGGIEIRGDGASGQVFVISGRDRGALAFRYLSKKGYGLSAGILESSDLDSYVAGALGAEVFTYDSDEPESGGSEPQVFEKAALALTNATFVVDGTKFGEKGYRADLNSKLLELAREKGKTVIALGPRGDIAPMVAEVEDMEKSEKTENTEPERLAS
jgi:iron complex transport system ATP-binding protein